MPISPATRVTCITELSTVAGASCLAPSRPCPRASKPTASRAQSTSGSAAAMMRSANELASTSITPENLSNAQPHKSEAASALSKRPQLPTYQRQCRQWGIDHWLPQPFSRQTQSLVDAAFSLGQLSIRLGFVRMLLHIIESSRSADIDKDLRAPSPPSTYTISSASK